MNSYIITRNWLNQNINSKSRNSWRFFLSFMQLMKCIKKTDNKDNKDKKNRLNFRINRSGKLCFVLQAYLWMNILLIFIIIISMTSAVRLIEQRISLKTIYTNKRNNKFPNFKCKLAIGRWKYRSFFINWNSIVWHIFNKCTIFETHISQITKKNFTHIK